MAASEEEMPACTLRPLGTSEATCEAARIEIDGLEKRELELKGKSEPLVVGVLRAERLA